MSADAIESDRQDSADSVRVESERKVYSESRGSPSRTPGRAGKGNSEYRAAGSARGDGGSDPMNSRSEAIWAEQREWVEANWPELPETWVPMAMMALGRARRGGVRNPTREQLTGWLERNGWPVEEIPK